MRRAMPASSPAAASGIMESSGSSRRASCGAIIGPRCSSAFDDDGLGKGADAASKASRWSRPCGNARAIWKNSADTKWRPASPSWSTAFEDFRRAFEISARERVNEEILTPKLRLDAELPMEDVSLSSARGPGIARALRDRKFPADLRGADGDAGGRATRAQRKASPARISATGRRLVQAIYFRGAEETLPQPPWDVAFTVERNEFNGRLDAQIADCRHSPGSLPRREMGRGFTC